VEAPGAPLEAPTPGGEEAPTAGPALATGRQGGPPR